MNNSSGPAAKAPLPGEAAQPESRASLRTPAARSRTSAALLWILPTLVVSVMVFLKPSSRTVTTLYHEAVTHWWAGLPIYQGHSGMNYLPQFALLFTPFQLIPAPWGDILWRWVATAALSTGLWRVLKLRFGTAAPQWFLWATLLAMPLTLGALRNGQANALLGAVMLHAAACLASAQWNRATLLLLLGVAVKPLGIVLLLLAPAVYAPLRWRLGLGFAALLALPFLGVRPAYALAQYQALAADLRECSALAQHRFADLNGILRTFGTELPPAISTGVRALAGLGTLGLWRLGAGRLRQPLQALWLHALAAAYLMVFNPMNEANSYVILAPALGFWAVEWLSDPATARQGRWVAAMALSMAFLPNLARPLLGNQFALIWHPTLTLLFGVLLVRSLGRRLNPVSAVPGTDLRPSPP